MKMLSDMGSIPIASTIGMALVRNGRSFYIARVLGSQASSIKASAPMSNIISDPFQIISDH